MNDELQYKFQCPLSSDIFRRNDTCNVFTITAVCVFVTFWRRFIASKNQTNQYAYVVSQVINAESQPVIDWSRNKKVESLLCWFSSTFAVLFVWAPIGSKYWIRRLKNSRSATWSNFLRSTAIPSCPIESGVKIGWILAEIFIEGFISFGIHFGTSMLT